MSSARFSTIFFKFRAKRLRRFGEANPAYPSPRNLKKIVENLASLTQKSSVAMIKIKLITTKATTKSLIINMDLYYFLIETINFVCLVDVFDFLTATSTTILIIWIKIFIHRYFEFCGSQTFSKKSTLRNVNPKIVFEVVINKSNTSTKHTKSLQSFFRSWSWLLNFDTQWAGNFGSRFRLDVLRTVMTNFDVVLSRTSIRRVRSFWWWNLRVCDDR